MTRTFSLPYPPSANRYWRVFRGRPVKSKEAREYQADVQARYRPSPTTKDVCVQVEVYRPAKRRDLDNCLKVVLDALQGIAYENDGQIVQLVARRYDSFVKAGAIVVTVSEDGSATEVGDE